MNSVSDLSDPTKTMIRNILNAYNNYKEATDKDEISQAEPDAKLPDAQIFFDEQNGGIIIILPERHASADQQVRGGAEAVAKRVLEIPKVKIAVEEPIEYNGTLISNVGWTKSIAQKPQSMPLFEFDPDAQGSISHQTYVRQIGGGMASTSRYAAEKMPCDPVRYNNPEINKFMAESLIKNTNAGDISVFPVGPDHLIARYDRDTLRVHIVRAGWTMLSNK